VERKKESGTNKNRSKLNYLKIIQKIPEQHTWEAHQLAIENSPMVHSAHYFGEFVCFPGVTTHCGCIFTAR
jgi:hypothetical protein